jgi:hypothetical protein
MAREVLAVLKIELVLSALLDKTSDRKTVRLGITQYGCPELLVHETPAFCFGTPALGADY